MLWSVVGPWRGSGGGRRVAHMREEGSMTVMECAASPTGTTAGFGGPLVSSSSPGRPMLLVTWWVLDG